MEVVDLTSADDVEITIRKAPDGYRVWVNVDGVCRLRAYRVKEVKVDQPEMVTQPIKGEGNETE